MTAENQDIKPETKTELAHTFEGEATPSSTPATVSAPEATKTDTVPIKTIISQAQRMGVGPFKKRVRI